MDEGTGFLNIGGSVGRLRVLDDSGLLSRAIALDAQLAERRPLRVLTYWRATPTHASAVGYRLVAFDREARRATRLILAGERGKPRPLPMSLGGFEVREANAGSIDFIFDAIDQTARVLLSDPVQLILTTRALIGDVRWVGAWLGRRIHGSQPSLPEIRSIVEDVLAEQEDTRIDAPPQIAWDEHGPQIRGAVDVTIVRIHADGTADFVHFHGAGPR